MSDFEAMALIIGMGMVQLAAISALLYWAKS